MPVDPWGQQGYGVRFDWGPTGAARADSRLGVLVVVDVLSFSTSVSVVVDRGGAVYPAAWRDARAQALAREEDAVLAVGRREVTGEHPWSLSPAALRAAPVPARLVLPSPNGSAVAAAAAGVVVAACLRNACAVADWLHPAYGTTRAPVTVVAAGERWPDGSLRPALEDLLGAGAVLAAVQERGDASLSPEAEAAAAAFRATASVPDTVHRCASGLELAAGGFAGDVEVAVEVDVSPVVPLLRNRAFRAAG
ncbi:2-phosphosulfolactate phosphatase [Geodermatophilus sp. DF01_2]|uniref:2-phosphosulfolactate phosphatase n=1 Tax=Geodermatophilus sp. DF01-2 TaxID=2559610 RepID=UPI001ADDB2FB|nr:2-phosphosulfolactate phosphatase [Geodermatophilus sp. DF01_2]